MVLEWACAHLRGGRAATTGAVCLEGSSKVKDSRPRADASRENRTKRDKEQQLQSADRKRNYCKASDKGPLPPRLSIFGARYDSTTDALLPQSNKPAAEPHLHLHALCPYYVHCSCILS